MGLAKASGAAEPDQNLPRGQGRPWFMAAATTQGQHMASAMGLKFKKR
jgi:hypothetical protein